MKKQPSKNLWKVSYRVGRDILDFEKLWICAPSADSAAKKARTYARRARGFKQVKITSVAFEGEIDVF